MSRCLGRLAIVGLLLVPLLLPAQTVEFERGVQVAGLWCFPVFSRPGEWVYIPERGRLALDETGRPKFSFVRYAFSRDANGTDGATITQADGGGILHFLVLYDTPPEVVAEAQTALRDLYDDDEQRLVGPLLFESGRYTLISSVLNDEGLRRPSVLATGTAPVMEGNQLALSFHLTPQAAMLLMESFRMDTPDISILFDLEFSGITDAYEARVVVDWSQVRHNQAMSAGGSVYFVSAKVEAEIDRLIRDNAIRMESVGSDANMEGLIARIYEKLLELMFNPVAPEQLPPDQRGGLNEALGALFGADGLLSSSKSTGFGAHVGYQLKDLRWEGHTVLDFNHRARVSRNAYVAFNIGDLHRRFGDDPTIFRSVNPHDPTFDQREIHLAVDGALYPEFEGLVNNVTVTLRKHHAGGAISIQERVVNRQTLDSAVALVPMVYGWREDTDRIDWLNYEYRTRWSFRGGGSYNTDWTATDAAMIELYAPFRRRQVQLINTGNDLSALGVRAVVINLNYPFFGSPRSEQLVVRTDRPELEAATELTLPSDLFDYEYHMTWIMDDGRRHHLRDRDSSGLIFLDPPPVDDFDRRVE